MSYTSPILEQLHTDEFTDVDFGKQADSDLLGWIPPTSDDQFAMQQYSPRYSGKVYPRDRWEPMIREKDEQNGWQYRRIGHRFQQREGSCVYNGLATCNQIIWNQQTDDKLMIPFSPMSGYRHNARSPNSGSYVGGAIKWSETTGMLPSADYAPNLEKVQQGWFDHTHGETGNWNERFPDGWKNTAKLFRAQEWEWITSVEEWVSALLNGYVCEGGRDRHAICHCGLAIDSGRIYSVYCNSWGAWGQTLDTSFGPLQSFGFDSESKIRTMVSRDGFCLRTMVRPDFVSGL